MRYIGRVNAWMGVEYSLHLSVGPFIFSRRCCVFGGSDSRFRFLYNVDTLAY